MDLVDDDHDGRALGDHLGARYEHAHAIPGLLICQAFNPFAPVLQGLVDLDRRRQKPTYRKQRRKDSVHPVGQVDPLRWKTQRPRRVLTTTIGRLLAAGLLTDLGEGACCETPAPGPARQGAAERRRRAAGAARRQRKARGAPGEAGRSQHRHRGPRHETAQTRSGSWFIQRWRRAWER